MHATIAAKTNYRTYGNLALVPEADQATAPKLRVIDGGRSHQARQADPFANVSRDRSCKASFKQQLVVFASMVVVTLSLMGAIWAVDILSAAPKAVAQGFATTSIAVHDGDTLWGIAEEHGVSGMSTQDVIGWIKDVNGIGASAITAGQQLVVPLT